MYSYLFSLEIKAAISNPIYAKSLSLSFVIEEGQARILRDLKPLKTSAAAAGLRKSAISSIIHSNARTSV